MLRKNIPPPPRGRKPQREKKLSGREKSVGGIPSQRGEIVAIVIVIVIVIITGFIGIIINIILTYSTITSTVPLRSTVELYLL